MKALRQRYGHAVEAWQITRDRLKALSVNSTDDEIIDALAPIGLPSMLDGSEAMRVFAFLDVQQQLKRKVLQQARLGTHYDPIKLVRAVFEQRELRRKAARVHRQQKAALGSLPVEDHARLSTAYAMEEAALERARANEALAKEGHVPMWSARSYRNDARKATESRKRLEEALVPKSRR